MLTAALLALVLSAPTPPAPTPPAPAPPGLAPPHDSRRLGEWPREPSGKTVSIGDHVSIDEALQTIATAGGWNLIANTGRLGDRTLVVTLRNAPVEEALDAVLEGSPLVATRRGNTVAVAPGRLAPAPEAPVLSGFDKPTGKRFTGELTDEPVDRALRKVADAAGLSVVFPPGLRGTVSGHFREAPVEDVLRAVLAQAGLVASREGSIVTVARGGGSSLVIDGRRRVTVPLPGFDGDLGREIDQAIRAPKRAADEARREAKRARREAKQARPDAEVPEGDAKAEADADEVPGPGKGAAGGRRHGDKVVRGDVTIGPGERARDVVVFGGLARLEPGATATQVTVILGSADIGPGATVDHEVVAIGGDIHVAPGAHVGGDAVSIGGKIVIDEGAEVEGQQTAIDVPGLGGLLSMAGARSGVGGHTQSVAWRIGRALIQFIVFFGLGLLLFLLFPRRVEAVTGSLRNAPGKAVLTGILGTLALPIAALLLVVTVIGIPFVAVLVMAVVAATVMGYTALALWFGRALPFRFEKGAPILQLAIGTVVLVAIAQVPVLGKLALVAGWLLVFGVVLRTRFGQPPQAPPPVYGTTAPPPAPAG
jgi:secretin/TonB-like protein